MNKTNGVLPMLECPYCGVTFHWDDYYELKAGDSRECQHCLHEVFVLWVEHEIRATLGTEAP